MKTEHLIHMLSRGVEPVERPHWAHRMSVTLIAGLLAAALLVAIGLGVRPDIGAAPTPVMMKAAFAALAAALMLPLTVRLMQPGRPLGWRLGAALMFFAVCAIAGIVALAGEMPERRIEALLGGAAFPWCVVLIPILATPSAALLAWLMRSFAPTRLTMAGAAIGALSGGVGAIAYSMYCPTDSVAFVVTWYALGIAISAALGATLGARFLRW